MKHVKVGPYTYDIRPVAIATHDSDLVYGKLDPKEHYIEIATDYHPDRQKTALLHEIFHAIDDLFDIELSEEQVIKLGKGAYMVLTENGFLTIPDLAKPKRSK